MPKFKVYSDPEGTVNSTLLSIDDRSTIVIDTQANEAQGRALLAQVQGRVLFVFNTHEHGDHIAGNRLFAGPIISSLQAKEAMLAEGMADGLPNCCFSEQLRLQIAGEEIRMQHFGGHCPGLAIMYLPQSGLLFTGDLVFNGRAPWMGHADFSRWIAVLEELATWDVQTVVPGHGCLGGKELLLHQQETLENFVADVQSWRNTGKGEAEMVELAAAKYAVKPAWYDMLRLAFRRVPR